MIPYENHTDFEEVKKIVKDCFPDINDAEIVAILREVVFAPDDYEIEYNNKKKKTPLPMPIILDGKIEKNTINLMGKNEDFVYKILDNKKLKLEDIFYAFYKDNSIFIIEYNDLNK